MKIMKKAPALKSRTTEVQNIMVIVVIGGEMSSVLFLPSEISRLVYGYLQSNCSEDVARKFLDTCQSMKECRAHKDVGFDSNFQGQFSLAQILNQYSALSELISENLSKDVKCTHWNIVPSLRKLLYSRVDCLVETCRSPTRDAVENAEILTKSSKNAVINTTGAIERNMSDHDERCSPVVSPVCRTEYLPAEVDKSISFSREASSRKLDSVQKSLVWDHSVQNILAMYSPLVVDRSSNVRNEDEFTPKKRNFEDMERERELTTDDTQMNLSIRKKRRKSITPQRIVETSDVKLKQMSRSY